MTDTGTHSEVPAPPAPDPTPGPPPPIGDPPPDGPHVPDDPRDVPGVHDASDPLAESAPKPSPRDLGVPEETIAGPGDGTEGPDAPDEPGPRPPGFPDPDAPEGDEDNPS